MAATIRAAVAAAKANLKINQSELAARINVTQGALWQWANARVPVPAARARELAGILELRPEDISVQWRNSVGIEPTPPSPAAQAGGVSSIQSARSAWPFRFSRERYNRLPASLRTEIETLVFGMVIKHEQQSKPPKKKVSLDKVVWLDDYR